MTAFFFLSKMNTYFVKHIESDSYTDEISNICGNTPHFIPQTSFRIQYSKTALFLKFEVKDKYVRCIEPKTNGKVWEDSCVEFFFAPDLDVPEQYFNLEINCCGTRLMQYHRTARTDFTTIDQADLKNIRIINSVKDLVLNEITEELTWTIECELPYFIMRKYSKFEIPDKGTILKANLYKTAAATSNPHYLAWNKIPLNHADFHRPEYFGTLIFE